MVRSPNAELRERDDQHAGGRGAEISPIAMEGPFENFPGPVLVVGRNGIILGTNEPAEPIARQMRRGDAPELSDAIKSAFAGKVAQVNPFLVKAGAETGGGANDAGLAFDLVVLPWAEGAAVVLLGRDVTLERGLRTALIESRQRYKDLVEASSDFAWETDAEGRFVFVSPRGALDYAAQQLIGERAEDFLIGTELRNNLPFTTHEPLYGVEIWFRRLEGEASCLLASGLPLMGPDGEWCGARGVCREITEQRAREEELARARHRERLLAYILRIVRDELEATKMLKAAAGALAPALSAAGVCIYRRRDQARFEAIAMAGEAPPADLIEPLLRDIALGQDAIETVQAGRRILIKASHFQRDWNGALCLWRDATADKWSEEDHFLLGEISAQIGVANQQLAREEELERRSATDPLTGLLNRRSFLEALEQRFADTLGRHRAAALFYIDLDNFKQVNDRRGHLAGDSALGALADILRKQIRDGDLAARLGGDEFGLFLDGLSADSAMDRGRTVLEAAASLMGHSGDPDQPLSISVGVALYDPEKPEDVRSLVARADAAMYEVKRNGKAGIRMAAGDSAKGDG